MTSPSGYAGNILRVDLTTGHITRTPTAAYNERYLGGRGIGAKIHWDEVPPGADALAPENRLSIMTGPVCGIPGFAGSRWVITGKSPINNRFSYSNLGGAWGAQLKASGHDGLVVQGKAQKPIYLFIDNNKVELRDASRLWGKGAIYAREALKEELGKSFRILAVGAAGENLVLYATLLADSDSSASAGLGAVMGSKNLKAIAVRGSGKISPYDKGGISNLRKKVKELKFSHVHLPSMLPSDRFNKQVCHGCVDGCIRETYKPEEGPAGKYFCQSAWFYEIRAQRYYKEVSEVPFQANRLCDDYGIDTRIIESMLMWLNRCYRSKLLTEEETGLPFSTMGSLEFIETLLHMIAFREGYGDILANGTLEAARALGSDAEKLITDYMVKTGENDVYGPRLYITTAMFYAMEPRQPIQQLHEVSGPAVIWANPEMVGMKKNYITSEVIRKIADRFWGSEIAADFSTYEGKAQAAVRIQDRQNVKESLLLCDMVWPILHSRATLDHVGDPTLESQICRAVTGLDVDEEGLYQFGKRIFNLQRAISVRETKKGREGDTIDEFNFSVPLKTDFGNPKCMVPGKGGEPFSRRGMVVDRNEFEKMKDDYYAIRGWDVATGYQTKAKLEELDLGEVAETLEVEGLVAK
ncbi:aldehyde ferredoxin oxidoreductase N-terminal domain-containing protein [Thermodesulfobacteriota bacterium]